MESEIAEKLLDDTCAGIPVGGRLNAVSAPGLKVRLRSLVAGGHIRVVLDLAKVTFVDSSGLAALVSGLWTTQEANGALKLASLSGQRRNVLRLTRLDRIFRIRDDVQAAPDVLVPS